MGVDDKQVRINTDYIEQLGLQDEPGFIAARDKLLEKFKDRDFGRKVAIHEAAHAVFMEEMGVSNVELLDAEVDYDAERMKFTPLGPSVYGPIPLATSVDAARILAEAEVACAGGVAVRMFCGAASVGDAIDYRRFEERIQSSIAGQMLRLDPAEVWKRAQASVDAKLGDEQFAARVRTKADQYFEQMYET